MQTLSEMCVVDDVTRAERDTLLRYEELMQSPLTVGDVHGKQGMPDTLRYAVLAPTAASATAWRRVLVEFRRSGLAGIERALRDTRHHDARHV